MNYLHLAIDNCYKNDQAFSSKMNNFVLIGCIVYSGSFAILLVSFACSHILYFFFFNYCCYRFISFSFFYLIFFSFILIYSFTKLYT